MKLISLNTWGGRAGKEGLLAFFERYQDIDIFCLQEIWSAPYNDMDRAAGWLSMDQDGIMVYGLSEIATTLHDHIHYFHPHHEDNYGLAIYLRDNLKVIDQGDVFVHKYRGYEPEWDIGHHARNIEYITIETPRWVRTIINFHGLWNGQGKTDSPDRLIQSENIIEFLRTLDHPYILCGDFNLLPNTESIYKLEVFGLRNLIAHYWVTSTRTSFYTKAEKFADYAFAHDDIVIHEFTILPDEVSDHSPLYVDFE